MQYGTIKIGQIVQLFTNSIGFDALLKFVPDKERSSVKKMIQRLEKEDNIRIDSLQQFENHLFKFCDLAMNNGLINQTHNSIIKVLYYDMFKLITNTNPYNTPTQNEVELQVMYLIASIYRKIYDNLFKTESKSPGETLGLTLGMFDFWKQTDYKENIKLIPSCFDFLFSESKNPKSDLFSYWENFKDCKEAGKKKFKTNYSKSINDWIKKDVTPSWKIIETIFVSPVPENIEFKESKSVYYIFKMRLFLAYFFSNFFKNLENQNLISKKLKYSVQNGIRWFYWYLFVKKGDFRQYRIHEVQNPMFSLMRFMVHPSEKNRSLINENIYEAFDKECGVQKSTISSSSLYYIPLDKIYFPVCNIYELARSLQIFERIYKIDEELSTCDMYGNFLNKTISEKDIEILSPTEIKICGNFFYNWFKGKYHVLCHEFETGLNFYRKAFKHRYFGGKYLSQYLSEFIALLQNCNVKKSELNKINEWATALDFCINQQDKTNGLKHNLDTNFEKNFPEESFIK